MKFSLIALELSLLASTALAAPHPKSGLSRRMQRRAAGLRSFDGASMRPRESTNAKSKYHASTNTSSDVQYSENWSGLAYAAPPSGEAFNAVSASFTVPTPSEPEGVSSSDGEYAASAWVGIDGNTYSTAILQTGIDFVVDTSGQVSFDAWYEWYPDYAYDFNLTISAGDIVNTSVIATSTTEGVATVENLTTGETASITLTSDSALAGENAEWIVEDFQEGNDLVPFANFGTVTFTDCIASTSGSSEGVTSATVMDLEDADGNILTDVAIVSDSSFTVAYTDSSSTSSSTTGSDSTGSNTGSTSSGNTGTTTGSSGNSTTGTGSSTGTAPSASSSGGYGSGSGSSGFGSGFGSGSGIGDGSGRGGNGHGSDSGSGNSDSTGDDSTSSIISAFGSFGDYVRKLVAGSSAQ